MLDVICFNKKEYSRFQIQGFASKFAFPFANKVCKGIGFDMRWFISDTDLNNSFMVMLEK